MQSNRVVRIVVEMEPGDGDRFSGWVTAPNGDRRRFDGWLELASAFVEISVAGGRQGHTTHA